MEGRGPVTPPETFQTCPTHQCPGLGEEIGPFGQNLGRENASPTRQLPKEPHGGRGPGASPPQLPSARASAPGAGRGALPGAGGWEAGKLPAPSCASTEAQGGRRKIVQSTEIFTNSAHFILHMQADEGNETSDSM